MKCISINSIPLTDSSGVAQYRIVYQHTLSKSKQTTTQRKRRRIRDALLLWSNPLHVKDRISHLFPFPTNRRLFLLFLYCLMCHLFAFFLLAFCSPTMYIMSDGYETEEIERSEDEARNGHIDAKTQEKRDSAYYTSNTTNWRKSTEASSISAVEFLHDDLWNLNCREKTKIAQHS